MTRDRVVVRNFKTGFLPLAFMTAGLSLGCSVVCLAAATAADVLNDLHAANRMEIHMGKMAEEKGATSDARDYGKTLVKDHEESDRKVTDLASKKGITLKKASPGLMDKMEIKKLQSLSGSEFDRKFAKAMIDDHKTDIDKMQSAQKSELPEDVRKLVGDTLPTLQKHLELAQKIYRQPS